MDSRTDKLSELGVTKVLKTDKLKKIEKVLNKYFYLFIKRTFDLIVAVIGLIPLAILSIFVKIAYVINGDFSPIFFVQKRIGKNGKEFKFYKFRSMVPNADEILFEMLEKNPDVKKEYEINKKLKNDPRITKMGNILRKTSLDELPQILNVLNGSMSLVGNRPYLPREKNDMGGFFKTIVITKPGITGYWQISGRSNVSFKERLRLEKYYSENANLKFDTIIFFKTFRVVFRMLGAK